MGKYLSGGIRPGEKQASVLSSLVGLAAAVGVGSCCFLPITLASLGLGSGWLGGIAEIALPYRNLLVAVSALSLLAGAVLLLRQQRESAVCRPGATCARPSTRLFTLAVLLAGAALLWAGYTYV
jgi:mercuric ion transport protein